MRQWFSLPILAVFWLYQSAELSFALDVIFPAEYPITKEAHSGNTLAKLSKEIDGNGAHFHFAIWRKTKHLLPSDLRSKLVCSGLLPFDATTLNPEDVFVLEDSSGLIFTNIEMKGEAVSLAKIDCEGRLNTITKRSLVVAHEDSPEVSATRKKKDLLSLWEFSWLSEDEKLFFQLHATGQLKAISIESGKISNVDSAIILRYLDFLSGKRQVQLFELACELELGVEAWSKIMALDPFTPTELRLKTALFSKDILPHGYTRDLFLEHIEESKIIYGTDTASDYVISKLPNLFSYEEAEPFLTRALKADRFSRTAIKALGKFGGKGAKRLIAILDNPESTVADCAASELGNMKALEAADALTNAVLIARPRLTSYSVAEIAFSVLSDMPLDDLKQRMQKIAKSESSQADRAEQWLSSRN